MIKYFYLFLFFLFAANLSAQVRMLDEAEKMITDKVKMLKEAGVKKSVAYRVDVDEVDWQSDSALYSEAFFDEKENIYTEINHSDYYSKITIRLNNDLKFVSTQMTDEKGDVFSKSIYSYDSNGLLEKREIYLGVLKSFDEIYEYAGGILKKTKLVSTDGSLMGYSVFRSDAAGNLTEEIKYNPSGTVELKYEYKYDPLGRCVEERIVQSDNSFITVAYSYDPDNNITEKVTKNSNGKITSSNKYGYKNGFLIEEFNDTPDSKIQKTYTYDGGLLRQVRFFDASDMTSYYLRYYYD